MNVGTAPGYVGASATTTSPGSSSVLHTRSMTCWPPVVTSTSSGSIAIPSAAITCTMQALQSSSPSVGPYWSAAAALSAATWAISAAKSSAGNVLVSGSPPASEITSGCAVTAIRSRIAEDFIPWVRRGERTPKPPQARGGGGGGGRRPPP